MIALSLPGIDFIGKELKDLKIKAPILLLTKGLKYNKIKKKILTIPELLEKNYNVKNISVHKGPGLAKNLENKKVSLTATFRSRRSYVAWNIF